ncbi:hypothetical protein F5H01DRAFT_330101 [Linnemannia elongata]|nr:hypothetical protein F5H01DRAFT_330101 [Linnemannia elongata]
MRHHFSLFSSSPKTPNSQHLLVPLHTQPTLLPSFPLNDYAYLQDKAHMAVQEVHTNVQGVRRVYESGPPSSSSETIYLVCYPDPSLNKDILLWDDILAVFSSALYVRCGATFGPASHRRCPRCHSRCCYSRPIVRKGPVAGYSSTSVARLASGISQRPLHTNFQRHHCRRQR